MSADPPIHICAVSNESTGRPETTPSPTTQMPLVPRPTSSLKVPKRQASPWRVGCVHRFVGEETDPNRWVGEVGRLIGFQQAKQLIVDPLGDSSHEGFVDRMGIGVV